MSVDGFAGVGGVLDCLGHMNQITTAMKAERKSHRFLLTLERRGAFALLDRYKIIPFMAKNANEPGVTDGNRECVDFSGMTKSRNPLLI